jgi:chromosome segregation ATPase
VAGGGRVVGGGVLTPRERELQQRVNHLEHRIQQLERRVETLDGRRADTDRLARNAHEKHENVRRDIVAIQADVRRLEQQQQRRTRG